MADIDLMDHGNDWLSPENKRKGKLEEIRARNRAVHLGRMKARNDIAKYSDDEPRDYHGRWTEGGAGGGAPAATQSQGGKHPGHGYSAEAKLDDKGVIHTGNVYDAVRALYENKKVELTQPHEVSVVIDKLRGVASMMAREGKNAPVFNLCNVTVKGTNLFCADSKGIPRVQMPQLKAAPLAGTPADKMPKDSRGEVDLTQAFIKHLQDTGYGITKDTEAASHLRATQNELNGAKVSYIADAIRNNKLDAADLVVSKDNYIVDGHHRWAAELAVDTDDGHVGDMRQSVARVNIGIIPLLKEAEDWTKKMGLPSADVKSSGAKG